VSARGIDAPRRILHRPRRALAVAAVLTGALAGVACGADQGGDDDNTGAAAQADEAAAAAALQETADAAASYVTDLGPEGAFAAVVIALDRGYTADQLVPAARLTADGTVDGAEPAGEPQGLVELPGDGEERASGADIEVRLVSTGTVLPTQNDVDPTEAALLGLDLTVGDAHRQAAGQAYLEEMGWPEPPEAVAGGGEATIEGYELTITILALARSGYSFEQIIAAVVTGDVTTDIILPSCYVIPDEAPELDVGSDDPCAMAARKTAEAPGGDANGSETASGSSPGQTEWAAELTWTSDSAEQAGPATITITRDPGTDDFFLVATTSVRSDHTFVDPASTGSIECESIGTRTLEAQGTFSEDGTRLVFDGTETAEYVYSGCPGDNDWTATTEWTDWSIPLSPEGMTGEFGEGEFVIPPPLPEPVG
jgi:hypothetical protein